MTGWARIRHGRKPAASSPKAMSSAAPSELERLLRGVEIPPCPAILSRLQKEIVSPNASLSAVGTLINSDVALAGSVLKVANSAAFGLSRKVTTIQQALPVLGMRTLGNLVAGVALRNALGSHPRLDRFWDSTLRIAHLCGRLTKEFRGVPADTAYNFGLFHDCGIGVLMGRIPDYRDTLQLANITYDRPFTAVEEERHATHHAAIGYLLCRSWGLPDEISTATLLHHDMSVFEPGADATAAKTRTLIALATLSACFVGSFLRMNEDSIWQRGRTPVMAHLGIGDSDFFDLREMAFETLEHMDSPV